MVPIHERVVTDEVHMPSRLYHYTSQDGLFGILSSKVMWGTRIHYLNDSTEFTYTVELLKSAIQGRRGRTIESRLNLPLIYDVMEKLLNTLNTCRIHVCCFSQNGDLLSQWRGYCPETGGFSIGFADTQLVEAASRQSSFIAPCIYDTTKQHELINYLLDDFFDEAMKAKDAGSSRVWGTISFSTACSSLPF